MTKTVEGSCAHRLNQFSSLFVLCQGSRDNGNGSILVHDLKHTVADDTTP